MQTKPLLVAQMSDLHYSAKNLLESDRCFGASVNQAILAGVDAAIVTGDSTDHALDAHEPAMIALMKQIKRLADHCPVLMLQGTFSHEPPGFLRVLSMIGGKFPITVADRIEQFTLTANGFKSLGQGVLNAGDRMIVSALPTLNKADLIAQTASTRSDVVIGEMLFGVLRGFSSNNLLARKLGIPSMVLSHGTVEMCITEHGVPMSGSDHELGVGALFAADADAVALGHIHKHQSWTNNGSGKNYPQVIAYAGSIGRFHHGEDGDKGALLWTMGENGACFELVATPARRTVDIFFNGSPDLERIRAQIPDCVGAFVRVRYYFNEEERNTVNRDAIRALLEGAADVQIEAKPLFVERQRAPGISTAPTLAQKLERWCDLTQTQKSPLSDRLGALMSLSPELIAQDILYRLNEVKSPMYKQMDGETSKTSALPEVGVHDGSMELEF